jgi:hypothetical protein
MEWLARPTDAMGSAAGVELNLMDVVDPPGISGRHRRSACHDWHYAANRQ